MGLITEDVRALVESSTIGFVATVAPDGKPNLSPKGSLAVWDDDNLYFANIASPGTIENIRTNPNVEANVVDVLSRRGYRFKGTAEIHEDGPVVAWAAQVLHDTQGPQYPCHNAVLIHVDYLAELRSPAYVFNDPSPTEQSVRAVWKRRLDAPTRHGNTTARGQRDEQEHA